LNAGTSPWSGSSPAASPCYTPQLVGSGVGADRLRLRWLQGGSVRSRWTARYSSVVWMLACPLRVESTPTLDVPYGPTSQSTCAGRACDVRERDPGRIGLHCFKGAPGAHAVDHAAIRCPSCFRSKFPWTVSSGDLPLRFSHRSESSTRTWCRTVGSFATTVTGVNPVPMSATQSFWRKMIRACAPYAASALKAR